MSSTASECFFTGSWIELVKPAERPNGACAPVTEDIGKRFSPVARLSENEYMRKYEEEDSLLHLSVRNRASEAVVDTLLELGIEKDCVNAAGLTAAEVGRKFCTCKRRYPALR